jgi:GntR family transcriptional repressor for pyruvate dehydrogenase complex
MKLHRLVVPPKKGVLVAERLLDEFRAARLSPGQRLPTERELAERLGVSRTVVREGLNALQMAGVVESRVGDGTYIAATFVPTQPRLPPLLRNLQASVSVVEAMQAREALDVSAAHLAIENATDEDLGMLDAIVRRLRGAIERMEVMIYLEGTLELHVDIAHVGGNVVVEQMVTELVDVVRPNLWIIARNYNEQVLHESFAVHAEMVEGIKKRDLTAAVDAIRRHYHNYPSLQH